jgi:PleD family two-component response regulator
MATLLCSGSHVDIALPTCYMTSKLIAPSMPATPAPHKLRILLVDDNSLNLKLLSRLLTRKFAHRLDGVPICVDDGLKAIQALSQDGEFWRQSHGGASR